MEATLHTNLGDIRLDLFADQAPETVSNFVGLATQLEIGRASCRERV